MPVFCRSIFCAPVLKFRPERSRNSRWIRIHPPFSTGDDGESSESMAAQRRRASPRRPWVRDPPVADGYRHSGSFEVGCQRHSQPVSPTDLESWTWSVGDGERFVARESTQSSRASEKKRRLEMGAQKNDKNSIDCANERKSAEQE